MKIAVIPARGGSKRIPRKNIKLFVGKPMISWPIATAIESCLFDRIITSTDDEEIAKVAIASGADVPFLRPAELSNDHMTTRPVIRHTVEQIEKETSKKVEHICCIYATAAFVTAADLHDGFDALKQGNSLFSFAGCAYPHPIQRAFYISQTGGVQMADPDSRLVRTQDLRQHFHDAAMFYWGTRDAFFSDVPMFSDQSQMIEIGRERAIDIDEPADWDLAEILFEKFQSKVLR